MGVSEVVSGRETLRVPFPASTAVAIGDLLFWNDSSNYAQKASARTDTGALATNQSDFSALFLGVAADQRLAGETSTSPQSDRLVIAEGVFDLPCASASFEFGDLVGIDRDSTNSVNYDQQVVKVTDRVLAIGQVIQRASRDEGSLLCLGVPLRLVRGSG